MSEIVKHKGLVPKLRFPAFEGEWKQSTIGAESTIFKGRGISKADIDPNGITPCIRYGELYTIYGEIIERPVSRTDLPATQLFFSEAGDVIIPSSGETREDIATSSCVMLSRIALGGDLNVLRSENDGRWLSYYIKGKLRSEIAKVAQGDSVVHLYPNQIAKVTLCVPSDLEQRKIADCLQSLDELIAAETEKLEALKRHKKGLLQQLFPAEGETTPRLRFPNFCEEWRIIVMDSIISNVSSGKSRNEVSGISKLYGSTGVIGNTNDAPYSGKYILIARVGANAGFLTHIDSERFGATDNTLVLSVSSRAYTQFLFFYLSNVNLNLLVFGSGQPLITSSQLRNLTISVPAFKEQTKIAGVLSDLDLLIVQTECDLLSLRNHKQGLMQQLFPSLDELDAPIA